MMRIYLSSHWDRRAELVAVRELLHADGHEVVARWLDEKDDVRTNRERTAAAERCMVDIATADVLVAFTEFGQQPERGGRQSEIGIAVWCSDLKVIICGPREANIFHHVEDIEQVNTVAELREFLRGATT